MITLRHPDDGSIVDVEGLPLDEGSRLVLYGPNGAGKTTVIRMLAGILPGGPLLDAAYLPQVPYLFRGLVGWNLGLGLDAERAALAAQYARRLGLGDRLADPAHLLSGGERGRIGLARTLASPRPVVLLDEPFAAVDAADRSAVLGLVGEALAGRTAVIVTHELDDAVAVGTHLAVMAGGRLRQAGRTATVLAHPADETVARIVGIGNLLEGVVIGREEGLTRLRCGSVEIVGHGEVPIGARAHAVFGAETVTFYGGEVVDPGTARNRFAAVVAATRPAGRLIEIEVDAGVPIVGLVTPGSADGLHLLPGATVTAVVKASAIRVVPA